MALAGSPLERLIFLRLGLSVTRTRSGARRQPESGPNGGQHRPAPRGEERGRQSHAPRRGRASDDELAHGRALSGTPKFLGEQLNRLSVLQSCCLSAARLTSHTGDIFVTSLNRHAR